MTDMHTAALMADHFDKIQKLPNPVEGVPNWRCVPGYQVYVCGQPTKAGFEAALEKVTTSYPKDGPIVWVNMRQEPNVYVNGQPICHHHAALQIGEYAELGNVTRELVENQEVEFTNEIKSRAEANGGKVKYVDCTKAEKEVEASEIISQKDVIKGLQSKYSGLKFVRLPVCNSSSPTDEDYDLLTSALQGTKFNAPVILNCQVGLSRSSTGSVISCLFREYQVKHSFDGLIKTIPGLNLNMLKMDTYVMDMEKDPLFRGEFEVVKELLAKYPAMETAKNQADKLIDLNGPKGTGGTGIKQLRENIAESKLSYEIMDDAAQAFLKAKIQDNITKYFMLIVFTGYLNEIEIPPPNTPEEEIKLSKSFVDFMKEKSDVATMIQKGKGKLKWERDVPPEIESKLQNMATTDFYGNLGQIIHDILGAANKIYRDMADVGDHKKRAKYRFSSKTLMSLLPADELKKIEDKVERQEMVVDFYDILGEVQKNKPAA